MARSPWSWLLVFAAGACVGAWLGRATAEGPPPVATAAPVPLPAPPGAGARPASGSHAPGLPMLSPAEREVLQAREAMRSAEATAPATYVGIDGKRHAFRRPDPVAAVSDERTRQAHREQLMRELEADPARFAREHGLSLKQVQWIAEGETDFPDALLEP